MATVMIRCPMTGHPVSTEIETEPSIFQKLPEVEARMHCPRCGREHVWTTRDAWLAEPSLVPRSPDNT
jgi:4-hydroxy-3-methylbut-2-en-1-yl diphosphate synthase IspG/GcpE